MTYRNHYAYLEKNLPQFFADVGVNWDHNAGIIVAHGDKAYGYQHYWEENGLHFYHGVAIFLLTYCHPYGKECRDTPGGWVKPNEWVLKNKDRFLKYLPPVD